MTRWAGLRSGAGKALSHLIISFPVREMVWKRRRRHGITHDLEMREQVRREILKSGWELRKSRISSTISCGTPEVTTVVVSAGVSCFACKVFESIWRVRCGGLGEFPAPFQRVHPLLMVGVC